MRSDAKARASDPGTPTSELLLLAQDSLEIARLVASHPSIDAATVRVLSGRRNARIDAALASNASTPIELLVHLAEQHAGLVLANPAFELAIAADPTMMAKIPDGSLRKLVGSDSVDPRCLVLVARLATSADVARAILGNPRTPIEALRSLRNPSSNIWGFEPTDVELHRNWQTGGSGDWASRVEANIVSRETKDWSLVPELARVGAIRTSLQVAVIRSAPESIRALALAHGDFPPSVAEALVAPEIAEARGALARSLAVRAQGGAAALMALDAADTVLSGVEPGGTMIGPDATSADLLSAIVKHRDWTARSCLNPGSPFPDMRPCRAVAAHRSADLAVLEAMIDAGPFTARFAKVAASSPAASPEFLRRISALPDDPTIGDDWRYERPREGVTGFAVAEVVASNPRCPPDLLAEFRARGVLALDRAIASNPSLDAALVVALAQHADEKVRAAIAGRPDLSAEVVRALAVDHSKAVKAALARSASVTDEAVLLSYCSDGLAAIRAAVASRHGAIPPEARPRLLADRSAEVRAALAGRGDLSSDEQRVLAADKSAAVRAALAGNRAIGAAIAEALALDTEREVVTALATNPVIGDDAVRAVLDRIASFVIEEMRQRGVKLAKKSEAALDLVTVVTMAASHPKWHAKAIAWSHPSCPVEVLRKRAASGDWVERALVAANPSTPEDVRAALADDWTWPVIGAAIADPQQVP
jgi:hypothetical protein